MGDQLRGENVEGGAYFGVVRNFSYRIYELRRINVADNCLSERL